MRIFLLVLGLSICGFSFLEAQERDPFREHILRKQKEARERQEQERKLNLEVYDSFLRKGLRNDDPAIRLQSIKSIMEMEEVPSKEVLLRDYLDDRDPNIRTAVLDYYGQKLRPEDIEPMFRVVEDEDLRVRLKLVEVLLKFQNFGIEVYDLIALMLEDKQLAIKRAVLDGLAQVPLNLIDENELFILVSDSIYDEALDLRLLSLQIARPLPLKITHDTLEITLRDSQVPVRQLSLEIVGEKKGPRSTKLITERLGDPNKQMRQRAVELLSSRVDENIMRVFENRLLGETDKDVRIQILAGLSQDRSPLAVSIISEYLKDPVVEVRRFAAQLLEDIRKTINVDLYTR